MFSGQNCNGLYNRLLRKGFFEFIRVIFGESGFIAMIVTIILLTVIIAVMFKINWESVFKKYIEKK